MDLFGTNNKDEVASAISRVKQAYANGQTPSNDDLHRTERAAQQAGSVGNQAREALNRRK